MSKIFAEITAERKQQDEKWGIQDHEGGRWLAILNEEIGELATSILNYEGPSYERSELVQIAAVAIAWIEAIDRAMQKLKDLGLYRETPDASDK